MRVITPSGERKEGVRDWASLEDYILAAMDRLCLFFSCRESVLPVGMGATTATLTSPVLLTQRTSDGCSMTVEISFSECTFANTSYCDVPGRGVTRTIS